MSSRTRALRQATARSMPQESESARQGMRKAQRYVPGTVFIIALQAAADNLRGIRIFPSRLSFGCRQTLKVNTKLLQSLPSCIGPPGNREKFVENSDRHDGKRQHHKI